MISSIIVNYNAGDLLTDCIKSTLPQVHEIIVVDNASTDKSIDRCQAQFSDTDKLQIIKNTNNLGFASACNIGVHHARHDTVLFLNPDAQLDSDCMYHLQNALNSSEDIGMVGGLVLNPDGSEQRGARRAIPTPINSLARAFGLSRLTRGKYGALADFNLNNAELPHHPTPVPAISGSCMLVRKQALEQVGLWDEGYFLHCEDLDLCMRFHQQGWQILFVPSAKVTHIGGACSNQRPVFVEWHKHKGMLRFYRKYFKQRFAGTLWPAVVSMVWFRFSALACYHTLRQALKSIGIIRG